MVQRIGTADSATPHPDPCGGQAPALHFLIPRSTIGLQFGTFQPWKPGIEVDWRSHFRTNDESGDLLSYQSLMPVATGTPRYEKLGALVDGRVQVSSVPRTPPLAGDKPQRYISLATLGCRCSGDGGWCRRPVPEFIPDRSPGHAFVLMTLTRLVPLSLNSYAN